MKEFSAQTGGRYTYVDDIVNLQELSLAFASIFSDCDNFIISGCEVSGTSISEGYIYINGKIRKFSAQSGITAWPQYIYERNWEESVAYASGTDKVGRKVYGSAISAQIPTEPDALTKEVPGFIKVSEAGSITINDALFGKYALLLQSRTGQQTVNDVVTFANNVFVNGALSTNGRMSLIQGNSTGQMYYEDDVLIIKSQVSNGTQYLLKIGNSNGFQFYVNDTLTTTISNAGIVTALPINTKECIAGNISIEGNGIANKNLASDNACVDINMTGYNGTTDYYRNIRIGNGKGSEMIKVDGVANTVYINNTLQLTSSVSEGMVFKCSQPKNNVALQKIVTWRDSNNESIATLGYSQANSNVFEIKNAIADITISGKEAVNIGPAIKENGELLSNKYVTSTRYVTDMLTKADCTSVYTTIQADNKFGVKGAGLAQFVGSYTLSQIRSQIQAVSSDDVSALCPVKSKYLSDMATTETAKEQIRNNIGAAKAGSFQSILKDTGWRGIYGQSQLYVRQFGQVVCIQGVLQNTSHSGDMFTLPSEIDTPRYAVHFCTAYDDDTWRCYIPAGSRTCKVIDCDSLCGRNIYFSMTYMV